MQIRRIKMDDHPHRGDIRWVLFEDGEFARPIRILTDVELDDLGEQVRDQRRAHLQAEGKLR